ncbi:hypothetical protein Bca101_066528 [Brassica carinata]
MSSKGESSTAERTVKKEAASVIPVKRKLVKTMAMEAIISAFSPSGSSRISDHSRGDGHGKGNGGRKMSSEELKPFKKKQGSVIPKKRELVKTKIFKAILFFLRPSVAKQISDHSGDGKRVYPTRP